PIFAEPWCATLPPPSPLPSPALLRASRTMLHRQLPQATFRCVLPEHLRTIVRRCSLPLAPHASQSLPPRPARRAHQARRRRRSHPAASREGPRPAACASTRPACSDGCACSLPDSVRTRAWLLPWQRGNRRSTSFLTVRHDVLRQSRPVASHIAVIAGAPKYR